MYIVIKRYKRTRAFNCIRVCARGPVLFTMSYTGKNYTKVQFQKFLQKRLTTAFAIVYNGLTVKRGIKRHEVNTMNTKELLFDLQLAVDNLKDTIEFIKDGATKNSALQFLRGDASLLRDVIYCLDNGGYDND